MSQFYVHGIPTKRRPRFTRSGHVYTDETTVAEEAAIRNAYRGPFFEGKVAISIDVYPKLPKSTPKGIKSAPCLKKPDVDNIAKVFMDALQSVAFADDKQVCSLRVNKHDMQRIETDYCICSVREMERE